MSDPNSLESQRFEPLPDQRHHRSTAFDGVISAGPAQDPVTPERWFETVAGPAEPHRESGGDGPPASRRGYGRGLVAVLFATSLLGAMLGAGGTYLALRGLGASDQATTAPGTGSGPRVSIVSDQTAVIAAVNRVSPAVVQIVTSDGAGGTSVGSGIVYDSKGWILTNRHVVEGAGSIVVRLSDARQVAGTTYGLDTLTDLAIVKIDGVANLTAAPMGESGSLQIGELAIAIGSPLGLKFPNSATVGIISALGRDIEVPSANPSSAALASLHGLIQTDAAINPGNSGGPLVDASGRVVGVTTAEAPTAQGIGFAVPIDVAKPIMQQALAGEKLSRPFIGVTYDTIDAGLKQQYSLPLDQGAWVHKEDAGGNSITAVAPGSPGEAAGIKTGDIITSVEGEAIDRAHELADVLVQYAPGRTVSVQVYRDGTYVTLMVTLGTRPNSTS
jgi:S1-C subfamily serine protease